MVILWHFAFEFIPSLSLAIVILADGHMCNGDWKGQATTHAAVAMVAAQDRTQTHGRVFEAGEMESGSHRVLHCDAFGLFLESASRLFHLYHRSLNTLWFPLPFPPISDNATLETAAQGPKRV